MSNHLNFKLSLKLFITGLLLTVFACSFKPEPPLRIGINLWPGYELLHVASVLNLYKSNNINIVELPNASTVMQAIRNGQLEGAALTLDEALTLIEEGIDLKVIFTTNISNGGDAFLAKPEITSLDAIKGKTIAVENTAVGAIVLDCVLKHAKIDVSEINLLPCSVDRHEECFMQTDAVVTFEPVRTQLLKSGAIELFNSSQIPNLIMDVVVVKSSVLTSHPKSLQVLIDGYFKAHQKFKQKDPETFQMMSARLKLDFSELEQSFHGILMPGLKENIELYSGKEPSIQTTLAALKEYLLSAKILKNSIAIENIADNRFLLRSK